MNLEAVTEILESAGVAVPGTNLFVNFMPTDCEGVLLRDPFGGTKIDYELPGYRQTSFMLIVRMKDYLTARDFMAQAIEAVTMDEQEVSGMKVNYMRPRDEPLVYQPSPGGLIEMITNIDCSYVLL